MLCVLIILSAYVPSSRKASGVVFSVHNAQSSLLVPLPSLRRDRLTPRRKMVTDYYVAFDQKGNVPPIIRSITWTATDKHEKWMVKTESGIRNTRVR